MKSIPGSITAPAGFTAAGIHCGIRHNRRKKDLALLFCQKTCDAAAVYTQNQVKGAPILVTREHLKDGKARAVICNSGNANTCNRDGVAKAAAMCELAARALGIAPQDVIVASTGVIGLELSVEPIAQALPALAGALSPDGADDATDAIMTTDTMRKQTAVEFELGGKTCRIGGIAKGSGMINPNMATMLSFVTTDADVSADVLHRALLDAIRDTFNMVCVDGDTSTNDTLAILASGLAGNPRVESIADAQYPVFLEALTAVCRVLARGIARDGEGATKLVVCRVAGAPDEAVARAAAKAVIASNLVKAAMFGAAANWGRVLCALGYSGAAIDPGKVDVKFSSAAGEVAVCQGGSGVTFSEEKAAEVLGADAITIGVDLHAGPANACAYGCDLTYDYVKINGDYRT